MYIVCDFVCTNSHHFEEIVERGTTTSRCGCGADARRVASVPNFALDGTDPGFPTAWDRWARDHEKGAKRTSE